MNYTVINEETGEVAFTGTIDDSELPIPCEPGQKVLKGQTINGMTHKINPKTGRINKIPLHPVFQKQVIYGNRHIALCECIEVSGHQIGISDHDFRGWLEVDAVFRVLKPETYGIETNTGTLMVTSEQWAELFAAILRKRQDIINHSFSEIAKCK